MYTNIIQNIINHLLHHHQHHLIHQFLLLHQPFLIITFLKYIHGLLFTIHLKVNLNIQHQNLTIYCINLLHLLRILNYNNIVIHGDFVSNYTNISVKTTFALFWSVFTFFLSFGSMSYKSTVIFSNSSKIESPSSLLKNENNNIALTKCFMQSLGYFLFISLYFFIRSDSYP